MTGWLILGGVAVAVIGVLLAMGVSRGLWTFVLAALTLGAAGYAWQGHPGLPGAPVTHGTIMAEGDAQMVELREQMFGKLTYERPYFLAADALVRKGSTESAVKLMLAAVRHQPQTASLWTWLGMVYIEHDEGDLSPPARLAFERAITLAPDHSGPQFFYGVALIRANRFKAARPHWARALALCSPEATFCDGIRQRLVLLDRFIMLSEEASGHE
ncbi:tetratricopeptide repeat protein [Stakelama sp. CBK3Z-3]|uniref:Tetratricopeptide repeat protein n=1 Tax=Stakelama flava TaxID=2860338 RepID=A0ABS6XI64_9SPHN|nr:tetratricopeptide repeat protein [Stakelama flava]MBW4329548.1 tetratricopeptide repeat protein [Stakelama flava]